MDFLQDVTPAQFNDWIDFLFRYFYPTHFGLFLQ